jgi:hypothetical protein
VKIQLLLLGVLLALLALFAATGPIWPRRTVLELV